VLGRLCAMSIHFRFAIALPLCVLYGYGTLYTHLALKASSPSFVLARAIGSKRAASPCRWRSLLAVAVAPPLGVPGLAPTALALPPERLRESGLHPILPRVRLQSHARADLLASPSARVQHWRVRPPR